MSWIEILLGLVALCVVVLNIIAVGWIIKIVLVCLGGLTRYLGRRLPRFDWVRHLMKGKRNPWADTVLPRDTKEELQTLQLILRDPKVYKRRWGQEIPLGLLLHGPPGTGKTLIAHTLAQDARYRFISVSAADIKASLLGESEHRIRDLYRRARAAAPCIVFFDEIESFASQRSQVGNDSGGGGRSQNSLTGQLLQEIDGLSGSRSQVFTIGATNHPELLDDALRSRLSYQVHIGLPDEAARRQLFYLYTRPYKPRLTYPLAALVSASEGLSGRDIETLCRLAAMLAHGGAKQAVGYAEFERAFTRLGKTLPPFVEVKKESCPACIGNAQDCPVCYGEGQLETVLS